MPTRPHSAQDRLRIVDAENVNLMSSYKYRVSPWLTELTGNFTEASPIDLEPLQPPLELARFDTAAGTSTGLRSNREEHEYESELKSVGDLEFFARRYNSADRTREARKS